MPLHQRMVIGGAQTPTRQQARPLSRVQLQLCAGSFLGAGDIVPIPFPRGDGQVVAHESVLEEVEDGELGPRHDISVGLGLDLAPGLRQRGL